MQDIILGQNENYEANENCWAFCNGSDIKNGIKMKFGNMLSGFPFKVNGYEFICSEILYLCGEFSLNTDECYKIQKQLIESKNGFVAKKMIKNKNKDKIRKDFKFFRLQWMLWVVWQKTIGNKDFRELLLSIPSNSIIIEDSSWQTSNTSLLWGCKNIEFKNFKNSLKKRITSENEGLKKCEIDRKFKDELSKHKLFGTFSGQNNMGKILMLCKKSIENNTEPSIDYDLLKRYEIFLLGSRLF